MKKAEKTIKKIQDTTLQYILEKNEFPNVSQICQELDIYRSTFYNYYSNVNEVIQDVGSYYKNSLDVIFDSISNYSQSLSNKKDFDFNIALQPTIQHIKQYKDLYLVLLNPQWNLEYYEYFRNKIYETCLEIQKDKNETSIYIAHFISAGTMQCIMQIVKSENTPTFSEFHDFWNRINHLLF